MANTPLKTDTTGAAVVVDTDTQAAGTLSAADTASTNAPATVTTGVTQNRVSGTPTANSAVALTLNGDSAVMLSIDGTFVGTGVLEVTVNGTVWTDITMIVDGAPAQIKSFTTPITAHATVAGAVGVRVRMTAWTSGSASVTLRASAAPRTVSVVGGVKVLDASNQTRQLAVNADGSTTALLAAGTSVVGKVGIDQTTPGTTNAVAVSAFPTLTKGTQGGTGISTQDLKDAGRNLVHYYTLIPVLATATDTLQTLTGTKGGATVTATTTPAVVSTGKTFRITRLSAAYISTATSGYAMVRLRAQSAGVVTLTSPVLATLAVGNAGPTTVNAAEMVEAVLEEGLEVAAGFGVGISVQGFAAATAAAVGYVMVSCLGYEY